MKIKIKALADIEFLSAKVDRKHNVIHVQARNLLDSTGQDCTFPTCSGGKYIAHGFITSVYEDLHVDGYRVLIHLKTRRSICPTCGKPNVTNKPACLSRDIVPDNDINGWYGNHRTTNRFLDWVEYLIFKYGVDEASNITGIKPRRLYYIRKAYQSSNLRRQFARSLVIAKSRHNNRNLFLVIDTKYQTQLLDYFDSPKKALQYILEMKQNNPVIEKVTIPADFKYSNELVQVFGENNVQYDFRSLQTMITKACFNTYKGLRSNSDSSTLELEDHLFNTPRTLLTWNEQKKLNELLSTNTLFHEYYYLQHEYWYSMDEKVVLNVKIKQKDVLDKVKKDKYKVNAQSYDKEIDDVISQLSESLACDENKDYILYKMNKSCEKYEESQYDETVEVDVDQEDVYE